MHIAIWLLIALGAGLWTLLAWGIAALLGMDPSWVEDLVPVVQSIPYGHVIEQWIPGWEALAISVLELTRALLGWAGSFGAWVVWGLWALGIGGLLLAGGLLSLVVALVRKSTAPATPAAA